MNLILTNTLTATLLTSLVGAQTSVPDAVVSAMGTARKENRRILLVCGDDGIRARLAGPLSRLILYEYVVVELPFGSPYARSWLTDAADADAFLVILDTRYEQVATAAVAELSDVVKTEAFLTAHQASHVDANEVYAEALSVARNTNRRVFAHTGAPW